MWRLSTRVRRLGRLAYHEWAEEAARARDARMEFLNGARLDLAAQAPIAESIGSPPPDDPIWSDAYWDSERQRITTKIASRSAGS